MDENNEDDENDIEYLALEIPLDEAHRSMIQSLESDGADIEQLVAANMQSDIESMIHNIYTTAKYQDS